MHLLDPPKRPSSWPVWELGHRTESSSALVPQSVLPGPVNTEPVYNQEEYRRYILSNGAERDEGYVEELMKERMRTDKEK